MNNRILLIDDDPDVLDAYKRNLRANFDVFTVSGSANAIKLINSSEEFAVVVSDYKMPEMDGITFLSIVRKLSPDTVRIIITGHPALDVAIDAVNEGNVFRFLTKPYPALRLIRILNECVESYNSKLSEKQ